MTERGVLVWILGFALLGSVASVGAAGLMLLLPSSWRRVLLPGLVSYATGTLLGAALLGMIPESLEQAPARPVLAMVLAGMGLFFVLEKIVLWRHCHVAQCDRHGHAAPLVLMGDALHNFVDGVVIAAAFLTSVPVGVATAIAVITHELPQEIGDFAILLDGGYARSKALLLNLLSGAATLPGALGAYLWLAPTQGIVPHVLAVAAGGLIYVAAADLVPALHQRASAGASLRQVFLAALGVVTTSGFHGH